MEAYQKCTSPYVQNYVENRKRSRAPQKIPFSPNFVHTFKKNYYIGTNLNNYTKQTNSIQACQITNYLIAQEFQEIISLGFAKCIRWGLGGIMRNLRVGWRSGLGLMRETKRGFVSRISRLPPIPRKQF